MMAFKDLTRSQLRARGRGNCNLNPAPASHRPESQASAMTRDSVVIGKALPAVSQVDSEDEAAGGAAFAGKACL